MNTPTKIIMMLAVLLISFTTVSAQDLFVKQRHDFLHMLNLSEEQKDKIADLKAAHEEKMIDLQSEIKKADLAFDELKRKGGYSRSDYVNAVADLSEMKEKIALANAEHRMDIYELLNAEQKEIWNDMECRRDMKRDFVKKRMMHRRMPPGF